MVHIVGNDWEKIGVVNPLDLNLDKCNHCNQSNSNFHVLAMIHINKILAWQVSPKFGVYKSGWQFMIMCPTCEKGYKFLKEKGRDEIQSIMLKQNSLFANVWSYFLNEHALWNNLDGKERINQINYGKKEAKRTLEDLAKLGMNNLIHGIMSGKEKFPKNLKRKIEEQKHVGFNIELK